MEIPAEKYLYPTLKNRMIFFGLCLAGLSLYFLVDPAIQHFTPTIKEDATLSGLQEATFQLNVMSLAYSSIGIIFSCVISGYFFLLGHKTVKDKEFPPNWALNIILVKTKVKTGKNAYLMGIFSYAGSAFFILQILFWIYISWTVIKDI